MKNLLILTAILITPPAFAFDAGGIVQNVVSQNNSQIVQQQAAATNRTAVGGWGVADPIVASTLPAESGGRKVAATGAGPATYGQPPRPLPAGAKPGNPSEYGNPDGIVSSSDTATDTTTETEVEKGLPSGTYTFHVTGNYGTLSLNVNGGSISGQDNFPDWRAADGQTGIKCGISGSTSITGKGTGTIQFSRVAWSGLTQTYSGDYKIEKGWLKLSGRWFWGGQDQGPWEAFMKLPVAAKPTPPAQKTISLALAIDADFQNEADCKDTIQTALRVTSRLIPAGSAKPVTDGNAYCKTLFPTANSPAVKVTMASQFVVTSIEECTTRLNTAKGYSVSAKQVVEDKLEEIGDVRELCEAKFLAAGDGELQEVMEKTAASADESKTNGTADLHETGNAQVVKIDVNTEREPASK